MPIPLYDTVHAAVTLYLRWKREGDRGAVRSLRAESMKLIGALTEVARAAEEFDKGRIPLDDAVRRIEGAVTFEESVELRQFFEQVAGALVESQKRLDEKSNEYNRALEEFSPKLPKTWYSIPALKAEMKLGFSQISSQGVNVVLFQNSTQKQSYGESTVTFEIAAGPLPPGQESAPAARRPPEERPATAQEAFEVPAVAPPPRPLAIETLEAAEAAASVEFPLDPSSRDGMLAALAERLDAGDSPGNAACVVLPSSREPRAQPYLVLVAAQPEGKKGRSLRAWYVEGFGTSAAARTSIFTYQRALGGGALTVPPLTVLRQWASSAPRNLHYLVRNLGDVLAAVARHAAAFEGGCVAKRSTVQARLPAVFDGESAVLRGKGGGYVLIRAVAGESPTEWVELHAARSTGGKVESVTVPDNDELQRLARSSPETLVKLARRLERILLDVVSLVGHG